MNSRVDKGWQAKGIDTFSTESIFGTLAHYGVSLDEAAFRALAADQYPYSMAVGWHERWKGTGQFSRFPLSAAEELWRRLCPNQVTPLDVAVAVGHLLRDLIDVLEKRPAQGTLDTRFAVVEAFLPSINGPRAQAFVEELAAVLGDDMDTIDEMVLDLEKAGHSAHADRFARLEESLFPLRKGIVLAVLKAARGQKDEALAELRLLAAPGQGLARVGAVSALMELQAPPAEIEGLVLGLMQQAQAPFDLGLAEEVALLTQDFLEWAPEGFDRRAVGDAIDALLTAMESRQP